MKPYRIREEAAEEIADAALWYEREAARGLGTELIAEYEARLETALQLPGAGTIVERSPGADGEQVCVGDGEPIAEEMGRRRRRRERPLDENHTAARCAESCADASIIASKVISPRAD